MLYKLSQIMSHPRLHMSEAVVAQVHLITSGAMNSRVPHMPHLTLSGPPSSLASPKSIILKFEKQTSTINVFWDMTDFYHFFCFETKVSRGEGGPLSQFVKVNETQQLILSIYGNWERVHMGDFPQPQQKYAGTGENGNFEIALIVLPEIKAFVHIIWLCKHSDIKFGSKYVKNVRKFGQALNLPDFRIIFNIFAKLI